MKAVKVSPKFQVVIPKDVRRSMRLKPGMRFKVVQFHDLIELVPIGRKADFWNPPLRIEGGGSGKRSGAASGPGKRRRDL